MYARTTTYRGSPDDVQGAIVHWKERSTAIRELSGNRRVSPRRPISRHRDRRHAPGEAPTRFTQAAIGRMSIGNRLRNRPSSR